MDPAVVPLAQQITAIHQLLQQMDPVVRNIAETTDAHGNRQDEIGDTVEQLQTRLQNLKRKQATSGLSPLPFQGLVSEDAQLWLHT